MEMSIYNTFNGIFFLIKKLQMSRIWYQTKEKIVFLKWHEFVIVNFFLFLI